MSVPSWKRELSKTEFIHETFMMCVDIGHIVAGYPKKYRNNYGDMLITDSVECLKLCRMANAIYIGEKTTREEYEERRKLLRQARVLIYHISAVADVFFTLCYDTDGVRKEKTERHQRKIGSYASTIRNLINGVLKSDRDIMSKRA